MGVGEEALYSSPDGVQHHALAHKRTMCEPTWTETLKRHRQVR